MLHDFGVGYDEKYLFDSFEQTFKLKNYMAWYIVFYQSATSIRLCRNIISTTTECYSTSFIPLIHNNPKSLNTDNNP